MNAFFTATNLSNSYSNDMLTVKLSERERHRSNDRFRASI